MMKLSVALDVDIELAEEPIVHCCAPCIGLPVKQVPLQQGGSFDEALDEHKPHVGFRVQGLGFRLM